jgi:phage shock protein A
MKSIQAMKDLKKNAEAIKANPRISEEYKPALPAFNLVLRKQLEKYDKYDKAVKFLRGSQDRSDELLEKCKQGKLPLEKYQKYLAKVQKAKKIADDVERFEESVQRLQEKLERVKRSSALPG